MRKEAVLADINPAVMTVVVVVVAGIPTHLLGGQKHRRDKQETLERMGLVMMVVGERLTMVIPVAGAAVLVALVVSRLMEKVVMVVAERVMIIEQGLM